MESGAGLKSSSAKIRESASRDRWPPLSSDRDCFQTDPNATRTSRPSRKLHPSGGSSFAMFPDNRVEKMDPKSLKKMDKFLRVSLIKALRNNNQMRHQNTWRR